MEIKFDEKVASSYKSPSQKIRVLTESWVSSQIYCPSCGLKLNSYENNRPVADFFCSICLEDYELKSKKTSIGLKIVDGAYKTMIERLQGNNNPNFFLLNYDSQNSEVINFFVVPKHFFVPSIIEKRNPLLDSAQRAGWVGCNILLKDIPLDGKIFYVKDRKVENKKNVVDRWKKTLFLREEQEAQSRGWLLDIMSCIDKLGKRKFTLDEIYEFADLLQMKHPNNKHIKDKIRQQLQILRDKNYLNFVGRGKYELV